MLEISGNIWFIPIFWFSTRIMGDKDKKTETSGSKDTVKDPFHRRSLTSIKLNGANYLPWSCVVTVSLRASGETSYITDAPSNDPSWNQNDPYIMTLLWNSLEPDIFNNVACLDTSK